MNPAPVSREQAEAVLGLLPLVDLVVPNEVELEALGGVAGLRACATDVVVTLGEAGCQIHATDGTVQGIDALVIEAVDATAAGDCFCGALAAQLAAGVDLRRACAFANRAAGISVSRPGAQPSIPRAEDIVAP